MTKLEQQHESLTRAVTSRSAMNYAPIFAGFMAKGIPFDDIIPRENVFTFNAWKALGRSVRKGEKGVKVTTFIKTNKAAADGAPDADDAPDDAPASGPKKRGGSVCRTTTVFHVSQTDPIQ